MKEQEDDRLDATQDKAPKRLTDDLSRLCRTPVTVPSEIDQSIITMARRDFTAGRRTRHLVEWLSTAAVAAAVLLVVFWAGHEHESSLQTEIAREDVDGSGRVDILDAFALARAIETKSAYRPQWDLNGDEVVDRLDVDTVALAAVSLRKERVR